MPTESLASQLQRIGPLAGVCVVLALALGTFALLKRVFPSASKSPAPSVVAPSQTGVAVSPIASPAGTGGGSDPLAAAQAKALKALTRSQQQEAQLSRRQAAAFAAGLTASKARNGTSGTTFRVPHPAGTPTTAPSSGSGQENKTPTKPARPTGGVTPTPHS